MRKGTEVEYLLLFYGFPHNHQGLDLNDALNTAGHRSHLLIFDGHSSDTVTGISYSPLLSSIFSKWSVLLNCLKLLKEGLRFPHRCAIAFNSLSFMLGVILKILYRSRLIYYCLEVENYSSVKRWLIKKFCDGIINVEENRQKLLKENLNWEGPELVFYNMPHHISRSNLKPQMRLWLRENKNVDADTRILMYAGSSQAYANLKEIATWLSLLPNNVIFALMMPKVPAWLEEKSFERVFILPSQSPEEVKHWLCDADIALLPYEAESIAVRYCSPQKLFDCLACGVPFIGSDHPIIRKVVDEFLCGVTCDFTKKTAFENAVKKMLASDLKEMKKAAFGGHEKYNYEKEWPRLLKFLNDIVEE